LQTAETILSIVQERGKRGLPLTNIYRMLYNPALYLRAYGKIYRNKGAMTKGATAETVDAMSLSKIKAIIELLRYERYRWTPVRRIYIEKKHSKKLRPLGMPSFSDKLLQEVMRMILEAYYEPQFSSHSHGFRPGKGCHTALSESYHQWIGTTYFVEGDIAACFDSLDHTVMMNTLREKIQDNRFLRLIETLLAAGYLEDWRYHQTLSGCPQGSILSPVLANVYLDKLDAFVETTLIPQYNKGERRKMNPAYTRIQGEAQRRRKEGRWKEAKALRKRQQHIPCYDTTDPDYRRLRYLRYADDMLLGFAGPHSEAVEIKRQLGDFLRDSLKLTLSQEKTLITHARTQAARFLGHNLVVLQNDQKRDKRGHCSINGQIGLQVPVEVIKAKCTLYQKNGKPIQRKERTDDTVYGIIVQYQQEFRGLAEYYQLAVNRYQLNHLKWVMERSRAPCRCVWNACMMQGRLRAR
jgi:group II intron reverse transcriptase/maturase